MEKSTPESERVSKTWRWKGNDLASGRERLAKLALPTRTWCRRRRGAQFTQKNPIPKGLTSGRTAVG